MFQLLQCLKAKSVDELMAVELSPPKYFSSFGPVIDKRSVLPYNIRHLMVKPMSIFSDCNVMIGTMRNEGFIYFTEDEVENGISVDRYVVK